MLEDQRPLGLKVLIKLHAVSCAHKQPRQRRLAAFERLAPQVVTDQLDEVERVQNTLASWRR